MPAKSKTHWTEADDKHLIFGWGIRSLPNLMKRLGRSRIAVIRRAATLELGGLRHATKSMTQFLRETGYSRSTIDVVAAHLGIRFRKLNRGDRPYKTKYFRAFSILPSQEQAIIQYLRDKRKIRRHFHPNTKAKSERGVWGIGRKPAACHRCTGATRPHYAKGYCKPCYERVRRTAV